MLVDILNEQSKYHDVLLIIVNKSEAQPVIDRISERVSVHRIQRIPGSKNLLQCIYANAVMLFFHPDVTHCHNHELARYFWLAKVFGIHMLLTIHNTSTPIQFLSRYTELFSISYTVKKALLDRYKIHSQLVRNGVRMDLVKVREEHPLRLLRIVQIGRLDHKIKGQDIALSALRILVHQHGVESISIDFIGIGESAEYLGSLTAGYGLESCCNYLGIKSREWIYKHLCDYDLLLQPSRYEGFGLTVVEAMAAKVPVIVSDVEGPMEIIESGKYGLYFKSEDYNDLAIKIEEVIKIYGSQEFLELIISAQQRVLELYDIRTTAKTYIQHYYNYLQS